MIIGNRIDSKKSQNKFYYDDFTCKKEDNKILLDVASQWDSEAKVINN